LKLVAQGIADVRQGVISARSLWEEVAWEQFEKPAPQIDLSIEREPPIGGRIDDAWGRSESLDPDNVGDIADEGAGHRG
jgi:hypothetical protein